MAFDLHFPDVALLLHMDGADASTTFTDSAGRHTISAVGNAQLTTASKKYGTASVTFDGVGDYLTIPHSTYFEFGSGDFTIEFWINTTVSTAGGIIAPRESTYAPFHIDLATNQVRFFCSTDGASWAVSITDPTPLVAGTWYHIAAVRSGTSFKLYKDGTSVGSATASGALMSFSDTIKIGADLGYGPTYINAKIDDVRITKGYARYTTNFTAPPAAFPDSAPVLYKDVIVTRYGAYEASNLAGYWRLDDSGASAADLGPTGITGTVSGGTQSQPTIIFYSGSSYIPGTIDLGSQASLNLNTLSVECWYYTGTVESFSYTNRCGPIWSNVNDTQHIWFGVHLTNGLLFEIGQAGATASQVYLAAAFQNNRVYHLVGTKDAATNTAKLYINGSLVSTNSSATNTVAAYGSSTIGPLGQSGRLQEIAVYNTALTAAQVLSNYASGWPNKVSTRSLYRPLVSKQRPIHHIGI